MSKFSKYELELMIDVFKVKKAQLERERNVWRTASQFDFVMDYDSLIGDIEKVIKKLEGLL